MKLVLASLFIAGLAVAGSLDRSYGISINAVALSQAYRENEVAADAKYKGAQVSVGGTVEKIGKDEDGDSFVILAGSNGYPVRCKFSETQNAAVARIRVGSAIGIKGTIVGIKGEVVTIKECSL